MKTILVFVVASALVIAACGGSTPHDYQSDLEHTVALSMKRGLDDQDLLGQIGLAAKRHDLSEWQSSDESFAAIGTGLREAGVTVEKAGTVADLVSGGDARRRDLVLEAFGD